jgi:hypothetical protein
MVGWSKKHGANYTHVAPRSALDALLEKLADPTDPEGYLATSEILPLLDPETEEPFPEYHGRTFLRWLRTIGVVVKNGRRGYALRTDVDYESIIESHWRKLPRRE